MDHTNSLFSKMYEPARKKFKTEKEPITCLINHKQYVASVPMVVTQDFTVVPVQFYGDVSKSNGLERIVCVLPRNPEASKAARDMHHLHEQCILLPKFHSIGECKINGMEESLEFLKRSFALSHECQIGITDLPKYITTKQEGRQVVFLFLLGVYQLLEKGFQVRCDSLEQLQFSKSHMIPTMFIPFKFTSFASTCNLK